MAETPARAPGAHPRVSVIIPARNAEGALPAVLDAGFWYFRVLKSGCKVEELQHHTAERLERAIAIKMVVGWRIQLMVQVGRETPDLSEDLLFSDSESRVLAVFARSRKLPPPACLGDAVGLVGRLGGWLGRKRDPPGAQLLWYGYIQLVAMAFAFELRDEFG